MAGRKAKKCELPSYFTKLIHRNDQSPIQINIEANKSIANEFNIYFANIGKDLSNEIQYRGKRQWKATYMEI